MRAQILRCAQDDKTPDCHPERSEGSIVDLWVITGFRYIVKLSAIVYHYLLILVGQQVFKGCVNLL
jgi:hypothetical protein